MQKGGLNALGCKLSLFYCGDAFAHQRRSAKPPKRAAGKARTRAVAARAEEREAQLLANAALGGGGVRDVRTLDPGPHPDLMVRARRGRRRLSRHRRVFVSGQRNQ